MKIRVTVQVMEDETPKVVCVDAIDLPGRPDEVQPLPAEHWPAMQIAVAWFANSYVIRTRPDIRGMIVAVLAETMSYDSYWHCNAITDGYEVVILDHSIDQTFKWFRPEGSTSDEIQFTHLHYLEARENA